MFDTLLRDLHYAVRGLRRAPGFTLSAVLILALGIGANAVMFGIIDRLMFRPHPYLRDPDSVRRVYIQTAYQGKRKTNTTFPYTRFLDLTRDANAFSDVAAVSEWRVAVGEGDASRERKLAGVSPSLFGMFYATPARGRWFTPAEDRTPIGALVAVISYEMWQEQYGGMDVLGKTLKVGTLMYSIVGVAPKGFLGTTNGRAPEIFVPITTIAANIDRSNADTYWTNYNWDWTEIIVRRKPGVTDAMATTELTGAYIRSRAAARAINPRVLPDSLVFPKAMVGAVRSAAGPDPALESRVLLWVLGVAVVVLLIACASVANLQLARVMRRRRELTVRLALGAGRARLGRQLLTEALVLSLMGAVAGLLVAQWSGSFIRALLLPDGTPFRLFEDARTIGIALACAVATTVLVALGPMRLAGRTDLAAMMKGGSRDGGQRRSPLQSALLASQVALSVVLLVGAALFVRSFDNARDTPLGYDARPVVEVQRDLRGLTLTPAVRKELNRQLIEAARAIPGVVDAAEANSGLFGTNTTDLRVPGIDSVGALGRFNFQVASSGYFNVMQTRVLRGRAFNDNDRVGTEPVALVSDAMAKVLWPGEDALGKCIQVKFSSMPDAVTPSCRTVIGVVENTAQQALVGDPQYMYYMPVAQFDDWASGRILVRVSNESAASMLEPVRAALTRAMPGDGFVVVRPLQERVDDKMRSWRLGAMLFVAFGGLACLVAVVGLYGVFAFAVSGRMHELGVRIALGAQPKQIVRLVVAQGVHLAVIGIAVGLVLAFMAAPYVESLLFAQQARDAGVFVSVAAAMALVAGVASALPARKAAKADPMVALRAE